MKTKAMKEREECLGVKWKDERDGYFSLICVSPTGLGNVAYIALPKGHPDIGRDHNELSPEVNGGLTFGEGNVFGWDYMHYQNFGTPEGDIKKAIKYFKSRWNNEWFSTN